MGINENARFVLDMLAMIERREVDRLAELYHPEIEFHWPPGLPYGGVYRGLREIAEMTRRFQGTWQALQPTNESRELHPRIVGTGENGRVVCKYVWKAVDGQGRRFETETLAEYQIRDGRLARAQMYYFDLPGMIQFLEKAHA